VPLPPVYGKDNLFIYSVFHRIYDPLGPHNPKEVVFTKMSDVTPTTDHNMVYLLYLFCIRMAYQNGLLHWYELLTESDSA